MMQFNELDKAEIKHEFRQLYKEIGLAGLIQVLYEVLVSATLLIEVIEEEANNEKEV